MTDHLQILASNWRPYTKGTSSLKGWVDITFEPFGLVLLRCPCYGRDGKMSIGMPNKPILDANHAQITGADGKLRYDDVAKFKDKAAYERFQRSAAGALDALLASKGKAA